MKLDFLLNIINDLKPGEFVFQSIDCDGSMKGPNISLIDYVSVSAAVPLVYSGGISSNNDIEALENSFDLSGVMCSFLLSFNLYLKYLVK